MNSEPHNKIQFWIVEYKDENPVRIHHIVNPGYGEKGMQGHNSSSLAFDVNELKRGYAQVPRPKLPFRFHLLTQKAYEQENIGTYQPFEGLPIEESGTIFDFYKNIGYDHKKKRYAPR